MRYGTGMVWALLALLTWWTLRLGTGLATWCFVDFTNLAFHEAGHLLFSFAGPTVHYLGGTLAQLLAPLLLGGYFLVGRAQPLGSAVCLWWLGQSLVNVSIYMADARTLALPLVGGGDHDWNELFFRFGMLGEDSVRTCATTVHVTGVLLMLAGLAWAAPFALPEQRLRSLRERVAERWPALAPLLDA